MLLVVLNVLNAISLTVAIYFARKKQIKTHKKWIAATTLFAVLLLVEFFRAKIEAPTKGEQYLLLMETSLAFQYFLYAHILAAVVSFVMFPFILVCRLKGWLDKYHKRLGYILYPIWMFSSISGVIVYFVARA